MSVNLRSAWTGGPHPASTNRQIDHYQGPPGAISYPAVSEDVHNAISEAARMQRGPWDSGVRETVSNGGMHTSLSTLVAANTAGKIFTVVDEVATLTSSDPNSGDSMLILLQQVFGFLDISWASDDTKAIVRETWTIKVPGLVRSTPWTNPGTTPTIRHDRTVTDVTAYTQSFEVNKFVQHTKTGEMLIASIGLAMSRLVIEQALRLVLVLALSNQCVPREFNLQPDQVKFSDAFNTVATSIGAANSRNLNCLPFFKQYANTAANTYQKKPPTAIIIDRQTRDSMHTSAGENIAHIAGVNAAVRWADTELARGKQSMEGSVMYTCPLVEEVGSTVSFIAQDAIVWHYAIFDSGSVADPISSFSRIWTGTDSVETITIGTLIDNLCCFDTDGYIKDVNLNTGKSDMNNPPREWKSQNALYTKTDFGGEPVPVRCFGDISNDALPGSDVYEIANGIVSRMDRSRDVFARDMSVLERYVSLCNQATGTLFGANLQAENGAGALAPLGADNLNIKFIATEAGLAHTYATAPAAAQQAAIAKNPYGFCSFTGFGKLARIGTYTAYVNAGHAVPAPNYANADRINDGGAEHSDLRTALHTFSNFCDAINDQLGSPITDAMDPTGNGDKYNVFFLLLLARNHVPLYGKHDDNDAGAEAATAIDVGSFYRDPEGYNLIKEGIARLHHLATDGAAGVNVGYGARLGFTDDGAVPRAHIDRLFAIFNQATFVGAITGLPIAANLLQPDDVRTVLIAIAMSAANITEPGDVVSLFESVPTFQPGVFDGTTIAKLEEFRDQYKRISAAIAQKIGQTIANVEQKKATINAFAAKVQRLYHAHINYLAFVNQGTPARTAHEGYNTLDPGTFKPTGFVVSLAQTKLAMNTKFRPANPTTLVGPGLIGTTVKRTEEDALAALLSYITSQHEEVPDHDASAFRALHTVGGARTRPRHAATDLKHRVEFLSATTNLLMRLVSFTYLMTPITKKNMTRLAMSKIETPLSVGAFFPVHMRGFPFIMIAPSTFRVVGSLTEASLIVNANNNINNAQMRALFTTFKEHDSACYVVNLAHVSGFGTEDVPKICHKEFVNQPVNQGHRLGYIPWLTARRGRVHRQVYVDITGTFHYPQVHNNFQENHRYHYDMAPWIIDWFKVSHDRLSIQGQMFLFGPVGDALNHVTASIPCAFNYTTANGHIRNTPSPFTYNGCPIENGSLVTNFLGFRPMQLASN